MARREHNEEGIHFAAARNDGFDGIPVHDSEVTELSKNLTVSYFFQFTCNPRSLFWYPVTGKV